ncbi:ATP-grasp domain-containing protein [Solitalea longa]|nr:ATP-grasp domain-containing protein [Solitalea longa]
MDQKVYLIKSNRSEAGTIETLADFSKLEIIVGHDNTIPALLSNNEKACIISESSIETIIKSLPESDRKRIALELFKDKYRFRELVKDDNFEVHRTCFQNLQHLNIHKKSVIKPLKGCFGTAVKIVDENTDLLQVKEEIAQELKKNAVLFSDNVLSTDEFIVEDFIEGEEYAVDMFYNSKGEPCIVNIYHHPIPKHKEYLHMIYYSSKPTFEAIYPLAVDFFKRLNEKIGVTNFPMHCEFKLANNNLVPIEINPMRFGGMGLGNLVYHSFGINPYEYFLNDIEPDWKTINDKISDESRFIYLIAYNAFRKDKLTHKPMVGELRKLFTEVKLEKLFDYQQQLAFGVFCLHENEQTLGNLLEINFDDYFEPITELV